MLLKSLVDKLLKEKKKPMKWLAEAMGKTFDGLKKSLLNHSIKYSDIVLMAEILEVSPAIFFASEIRPQKDPLLVTDDKETHENYLSLNRSLDDCKELNRQLKDQLKDKELIISLISKTK
ncbi:hypothetical protein PBAL39_11417 [Pedobacter sp. BAL39]|uniref:hypothetical protein n=1 Tax=Pedobacter sp. BAL39 TaxID=391596 RepID=UPI000155982F|nr:hypothetical protein [Pedobacter sp. BAL39]EDM36310.1 hypothetical protein PBAL39_11417 [Pedobacter sp. BAL39]